MPDTLEDKQVAITVKQLGIYIAGVVAVMLTIMSTYYSLKSDLSDGRRSMEILATDGHTRDEQIKTIQLQIQTIQLQIATMQAQRDYDKKK